jgi:hypothetical protein
LIWKRPSGANKSKAGKPAGSIFRHGYRMVCLRKRFFMAHRVIWAIIKQEDPLETQIDHINGNKLDNRIANLRKATNKQNACNQKAVKGYHFNKRRRKWIAGIGCNYKNITIGYFDTEEQARQAYLRAKEKLHGEFMPTDMKHELGQIDGPTSQLNIFDD